ncbi:hypothetical protein AAGT70_000556 [Klebsiella variicola]|uniref:hypothetical protein n=1 Tax=Klebsiella TaxID=570 RepID=UPI0020621D19|nr:hypothetical protein [Klebsiella michiganensis]ELB6486087.1 hypothetical protein [Raoultella ornithinolytica]MCW9509151.1 hypothetical protein [Klebsiella michiganensis]DAV31483.1 MAG TPA: hypothetical protein [Caudoviricetes sp.]HBX5522381.1 hypothetical protein [Klebsiella pneumoniae]
MLKTFQVDEYAVNKRGNTVGIHYTLTSASPDAAKSTAQLLAQHSGYTHVRITRAQEVAA